VSLIDPGKKLRGIFWIVCMPALSGALLILSFPKYDFHLLAWVALAPLLLSILTMPGKSSFFQGYVCGLVFFPGVFAWIFEVPGYKLIHHIILDLYLSLYFGLFGLILGISLNRWRTGWALILAPFFWVLTEYIRAHVLFLSFPWNFLAHSQYQNTSLIQFAEFTGAYGVSFFLVGVNSCVALATIWIFGLRSYERGARVGGLVSTGSLISAIVVWGLCSVAAYSYGGLISSRELVQEPVKISVLQGNIDREKKMHPMKYASFIMDVYSRLSLEASKDKADLIVWPEASTPGYVLKNLTLMKYLATIIRKADSYFVIGSSEYPKFVRKQYGMGDIGNTALFFSPKGSVLGQYLKIRLVPFGETIPMEGVIPWPEFIVPEGKKKFEVPGRDFTLFEVKGKKFGTVICWEIIFPGLIRQFVRKGANFIVNITNEGWFGLDTGPHQMLAISVFRAIENRVFVAKAGNVGVSGFIDPLGRIVGRVTAGGKDVCVRGYLTGRVAGYRGGETFYTAYGDVFAYLCIAVTLVAVFMSFFGKKTRP